MKKYFKIICQNILTFKIKYYLCISKAIMQSKLTCHHNDNKTEKMSFFLRYTATPKEDLERGTSLHLCDGPEQEGAEMIDGIGWAVVLSGLCAHDIEADNEEEAIEDAINTVLWARQHCGASGNYKEGDGYAAFLFEGSYLGEDCDDGVVFRPNRIITNISMLINNENNI